MRRHRAFFLSCLLAFTAGHMFNYTVILYLQEAVGSDLLSGIGFGLAFGSSLVFGWFAGVLCDRVPPHRVIHAAQALFVAGLTCLWWAQSGASAESRVAWVLGGAFLGGLGWSFAGPARLTTLGQIVRPEELRPATILFNLQVLVGFGLAPLIIGLVRSRAGWGAVIAAAAGGFVVASLLIARLRTHANAVGMRASVLADIREGFRAVGADPLLAQLMLAAVLAYAMTGPLQILLPKLAREILHLTELQRGAYLGLLALSLIAGGRFGSGAGAPRAPWDRDVQRHCSGRHAVCGVKPDPAGDGLGRRLGGHWRGRGHGHQPGGGWHSGTGPADAARSRDEHVFRHFTGGPGPLWRGSGGTCECGWCASGH